VTRMLLKCKCGAMFFFVEMVGTGKRMPVDAKPVKRLIIHPGEDGVDRATVGDVYVSHFETCPEAQSFRRARGRASDN
jgi:hypothetical protein